MCHSTIEMTYIEAARAAACPTLVDRYLTELDIDLRWRVWPTGQRPAIAMTDDLVIDIGLELGGLLDEAPSIGYSVYGTVKDIIPATSG